MVSFLLQKGINPQCLIILFHLLFSMIYIQGGLRCGGLTPAGGSAHARKG